MNKQYIKQRILVVLTSLLQSIGVYIGEVLCDLGSSINLMPLETFKRTGGLELQPYNFSFPTEMTVINMEDHDDFPLLLGRSFLTTAQTLINVEKGDIVI